jgi:hypothetical protein
MHGECAETIDISVCNSARNGIYSHENTTRRGLIVSPIQGGHDVTKPMRSAFIRRATVSCLVNISSKYSRNLNHEDRQLLSEQLRNRRHAQALKPRRLNPHEPNGRSQKSRSVSVRNCRRLFTLVSRGQPMFM